MPAVSRKTALFGAASLVGLLAASGLVAQSSGLSLPGASRAGSGQFGTIGAQSGTIRPIGVGSTPGASVAGGDVDAIPRTASASRWVTEFIPFVEGAVTYSDNINLAPDGFEESDTVFSATAGATFALDVAGNISEVFVDADDLFSGNAVAGAEDRSRVYSGLISPSIQKNIGGWANAELRYGLRGEFYSDDDIDGGYANIFRATLASDPNKFRRFGWLVGSEYEDFQRESDDGEDRTRWSTFTTVSVPVSRTVALTATAGYDEFSNDLSTDFDGFYGNVGAVVRPSARVQAQGFVGYRYDGVDYGANVSYALSDTAVAGLVAGRSVQFSTLDTPLAFDTNRAVQNNLTDFETTFEDAVVDNVGAFISGQGNKTAYNFSVKAQRRDFDSLFEDETLLSADLSVSRALTNRISLDLGAGYSRFDLEGSGDQDFDTLSLGAGLSYGVTENINVFGRYTYTERFADDDVRRILRPYSEPFPPHPRPQVLVWVGRAPKGNVVPQIRPLPRRRLHRHHWRCGYR